MPKQFIDWAPGIVVLDGRSVPPRCATDWGNGHRCGRIADHQPGHHCAACSRTFGHDPVFVDHNDDPPPPCCRCDAVKCRQDDSGDHCIEQSCGVCLHGCPASDGEPCCREVTS